MPPADAKGVSDADGAINHRLCVGKPVHRWYRLRIQMRKEPLTFCYGLLLFVPFCGHSFLSIHIEFTSVSGEDFGWGWCLGAGVVTEKFRIQTTQFDACICRLKLPVHFAEPGITILLPCGDLKREQLTESQFYAWRRTIGERDDTRTSGPAFVPAVVTEEAARESSIAVALPSGCVLRFSGPMATEQLADLVIALQSRCER